MVKKVFSYLFLFLTIFCTSAFADYYFNVEVQETHLWINKDGSADIWYFLRFNNHPSGKTIDIIDIGLPFDSYRLETAQATVNGHPAFTVKKSEYLDTGVEIHLGSYSIPPGGKGEVTLKINQPEMVFADDIDKNYASVELLTSYFGSKYVYGPSKIEVYFHFPPGVKPEELRHHKEKFTSAAVDKNGRVYYYWLVNGTISLAYRFGASFPNKYLEEGAVRKITIFSRIGLFFSNIFRDIFPFPLCTPCLFPWDLIIFFVILGIVGARKRRLKYFSPEVSAHGVGIKRGLTAVEAAVMLERPLDKVIAMVVFGLLKKGYARVKNEKPFALEKISGRDARYHTYEASFLEALDAEGKPDTTKLKKCIVDLIKDVQTKLKGFNIRQTREYYEGIVETAWKHVQNADLENSIDWVMVDKDFDVKFDKKLSGSRPINSPTWWPYYHYGYYGRPYAGGTGGTGGPGKATVSFKQFANSLVSGFENASHNAVSSIESFTSGVTSVTNPPPKTSSSGYRSGGGGGCACACACAGCACACAGGGR